MYKSAPGLIFRPSDITALCRSADAGSKRDGQSEFAALKNSIGVTTNMTGIPGSSFPGTRMRRMRRDEFSRRLMRETHLSVDSLIYPIFVVEGTRERQPVASMPGIERLSVDQLLRECESLIRLKIPAIALFPVTPEAKKTLDGARVLESERHRSNRGAEL